MLVNSGHILVVDDSRTQRLLLAALLKSMGHVVESVEGGPQALKLISPCIDLVLSDVNMPEMDGFEVVRRLRAHPQCGDVPIIMVTTLTAQRDRLEAVEAGANDFITKPVDQIELRVRTASLLRMKRAQDAVKRHRAELEKEVQDRTEELRRALESLVDSERAAHQAHLDTVCRLAIAAEYRDHTTASHLHRVSQYCALIGRQLRMPAAEIELLIHASTMHDIGKIGIPDSILLGEHVLTLTERLIMQQHTAIGARILSGSASPLLQAGESIALAHHERWDGTGYPGGIKGEDIPLYARICAIADVFDALTTARPYKKAFSNEKAITIMTEGRGHHFDPRLLDLFLGRTREIVQIQAKYGSDT